MARSIERPDIALILAMIREWVDLLANRDFDRASEYLSHTHPGNEQYTGRKIEESLGLYSRQYREAPEAERRRYVPRVTRVEDMESAGENMTVYKAGEQPAVIEYDMPISGKWSDLTAKFRLIQHTHGYALELIDLHVL
jgi:hypothetical protein